MKNKKGFTLIELIAVVIILAAIALVTFPALLNQISNTKGKINDATNKLIYSAVKSYVNMSEGGFTVDQGHLYVINIQDLIDKNYLSKETINNATDNKSDEYDRIIIGYNDDYSYKFMKKNVNYGCSYSQSLTINGVGRIATPENPFDYGTEYACQVGESTSEIEKFYVLGTDSKNVLLLMNKNLDDSITNWCKGNNDNSCGAVTAKQVLSDKTSSWIFPTMLPTLDQLVIANGGSNERTSSSRWMITNLPYNVNGEEKGGYWTSTPCISDSGSCAISNGKYRYAYAQYYGSPLLTTIHQVGTNKDDGRTIKLTYGIRPVIVVPKELITTPE